MADNSLYDLLGVSRTSSKSEIRKAYHRLAKQYHPDKNQTSESCQEKFKEMSYAYDILSDPQKRRKYDSYGLRAMQEPSHPPSHPPPFPWTSPFDDSFFQGVFNNFFASGGFPTGPRKCPDTTLKLKVTLEDLYNGKTTKLKLNRQAKCKSCNGLGCKSGNKHPCPYCKGYGARVSFRELGLGLMQQIEKTCSECNGEGLLTNPADICPTCMGKCYLQERKILDVKIYPGLRNIMRVVFPGEGDEAPNMIPGDIIVVLSLQPHDKFSLIEDDLFIKMDLTLTEALCGFRKPLNHLDSRLLIINYPPGKVIKPGITKKIEGEGFPAWPKKGDLIIEFNVIFPESNFTTPENIKKIEKFFPPHVHENYNMQDEHVEAVELTAYDHKQQNQNHHHNFHQYNHDHMQEEDSIGCVAH